MNIKETSGKLYTSFNALPPWSKGVIALGVGLGLFFVGKKFYHIVFPNDSEKRNKELVKAIDNDIDKWHGSGMMASFNQAEYQAQANTCYEGMRYVIGDNYDSVEETLKKMKNNLDVALLMKAFGVRQDYALGIDTGEPKDLFTFVQSELGDEWGGLTSYRVKSINADWTKKGITYQI
jgi:hypothetical protein